MTAVSLTASTVGQTILHGLLGKVLIGASGSQQRLEFVVNDAGELYLEGHFSLNERAQTPDVA